MLHDAIINLRQVMADMEDHNRSMGAEIYSGLHTFEGMRRERVIAYLLSEAVDVRAERENSPPPTRKEMQLAVELAEVLGPDLCQRLYHTVVAATRLVGSRPKGGK